MQWRWVADWLWGLPLLILTVVLHVSIFVLMVRTLVRKTRGGETRRHRRHRFTFGIALIALGAAALHSFEAGLWAALYLSLGALPDGVTAMLYSLSAITSYGHAGVFLEDRWKLLGAIEAMNGLILFGLTTAFLFSAIEKVEQSPP
jgi:4-amino-4-deoxy-L-arabinose transferase-like glycosyltransferase